MRGVALAGTVATFLVSLAMYAQFIPGEAGFQLVERMPWIPSIGADWHLGVDGISLFLMMLTTLLSALCVVSSWGSVHERIKEYHFFFLLLESGTAGGVQRARFVLVLCDV